MKRTAVDGGMSALGAGFYSIGIPRVSIPFYERQLKLGKIIVIAVLV